MRQVGSARRAGGEGGSVLSSGKVVLGDAKAGTDLQVGEKA